MIVETEPRHVWQFGEHMLGGAPLEDTRVLERDGVPIAFFRVALMWPGVGQVAAHYERDALQGHGRWLVRQVRELLGALVARDELRQVRCLCYTDAEVKLCKLIGFEYESRMFAAGPTGDDIFMMVWNRRV